MSLVSPILVLLSVLTNNPKRTFLNVMLSTSTSCSLYIQYAVRAPIAERNRPAFLTKAKEPILLILDMSNGREGYGGRKGGNRRERGRRRRAFYCSVRSALHCRLRVRMHVCVCVCVCVCVLFIGRHHKCGTLFIPKALQEVVSSEQMCRTFFALAHTQLDHPHNTTRMRMRIRHQDRLQSTTCMYGHIRTV